MLIYATSLLEHPVSFCHRFPKKSSLRLSLTMPAEPSALPEHGTPTEGTPRTERTEHHYTHTTHHFKEKLANVSDVNTTADYLEGQDGEELRATKSTRLDAAGMRRMGKEQQLVRNFRQLSMTSFVAIATGRNLTRAIIGYKAVRCLSFSQWHGSLVSLSYRLG